MIGRSTILLALAVGCPSRLHTLQPTSQDTDLGVASDTTDGVADTDLVLTTCPPPTDVPHGTTEDGRPNLGSGRDGVSVDEELVWLACCQPARIGAAVSFGGWVVDIYGVEDGKCVVDLTVGIEGGSSTWACRLDTPVVVWPAFRDPVDPPDPTVHPECTRTDGNP